MGFWNLLNEDCVDISDWIDADLHGESTQVTFDNKSCFKFDTKTFISTNSAQRYQTLTWLGGDYTLELNLYLHDVGNFNSNDYLRIKSGSGVGIKVLNAFFASDGLFIEGASGSVEVGNSITQLDIWQKWRFEVDVSENTVNVYLNDVLIQSNIPISTGSTNLIIVGVSGYGSSDRIVYLDYIKISSHKLHNPLPTFYRS